MERGQMAIELLMLLSVSLVALTIIYSVYSGQLDTANSSRESAAANATLRRMVDTANSLYISGAGSKALVHIEIPKSIDMDESGIYGKSLLLRLSNGTDLVATADVNFTGGWKMLYGDYVTGGYDAVFVFDGNSVSIFYDDFELSSQSLMLFGVAGSTVGKSFSVKNISSETASFSVGGELSGGAGATIFIDPDAASFSLLPQESRRIDFNISLDGSARGNYSGTIIITGEISDGVSFVTIAKQIVVSLEAQGNPVVIGMYPKVTSFTSPKGASFVKSFSLCNYSATLAEVSWSRSLNPDANIFDWFDWPPADSLGNAITSVGPATCASFDLNFFVPLPAEEKVFDANITATHDGNSVSANLNFTVSQTAYVGSYKYLFFASQNDFDSNANWFSSYFSTATQLNRVSPTGELDWNKSANYAFQSSDYNRDMNGLVGYWKLNDKNSDGWVLNSATGVYDGNLWNGADTNAVGLWDTNAGWFDGSNNYVNINNIGNYLDGKSFTVRAWIKAPSFPNSYPRIIDRVYNGQFAFYVYNGRLGGALNTNGTDVDTGSGSPSGCEIPTNVWAQVVMSYDGETLYFHKNGTACGNSTVPSGILASSTSDLRIGERVDGTLNRAFNGSIEEVAIWNRLLSDSEISADYNRFLQSEYSSAVLDLNSSPSYNFNSIKVNSDTNYNFGSELSAGEKFFDQNLVGLWHLNDKNVQGWVMNSVTGVRDGNLWNGADTNAVGLWDTNAGYFDGSKGAIVLPMNFLSGKGEATISGWFKTTDADGAIISQYGNASNYSYYLGVKNGKAEGCISTDIATQCNASGGSDVNSSNLVNDNFWHNAVLVYNGSNVYMYLDGVLTNNIAKTGTIPVGAYLHSIGIQGYKLSNTLYPQRASYLNGSIDEVALWNRALSASEIADLYRKGAARLDLNVYSCSDASCNSVVDVNKFTTVQNNVDLNLSLMIPARYFKYSAGLNYASGIPSVNSTPNIAVTGFPFFSDVNFNYFS